jgi:hypothetical protein
MTMANFERDLEHEARMRRRLQEAVEQLAENSADKLGRLMGYTNGGFIREIVKGTKPVGKAILARINNVPGGEGWFDKVAGLGLAYAQAVERVDKELSQKGSLSDLSLRALSLARRFDSLSNDEHRRIAYALMDNALQQFESMPPAPAPAPRKPRRPPGPGR